MHQFIGLYKIPTCTFPVFYETDSNKEIYRLCISCDSTTSNASIGKSQNVQQYYICKMSQQFYTTKYTDKLSLSLLGNSNFHDTCNLIYILLCCVFTLYHVNILHCCHCMCTPKSPPTILQHTLK
jgi:hypothetical protein